MQKEVSAVTKTYDFALWLLPHLAKFERQHRFTLEDRLEEGVLEILELCEEGNRDCDGVALRRNHERAMAEQRDKSVGYLATVHLDENGQVKMPQSARRRLRLKAGSALTMLQMGQGVLLLPEQEELEAVCERIRRTLLKTGRTKREILTTLPEARQQVFKELYGELNDDEPS